MTNRLSLFPLAIVAALALAGCGSDGDDTSSASDTTSTAVTSDSTAPTPIESTTEQSAPEVPVADEPAANDTGTGAEDDCRGVLTPDEVESILGVPGEISGAGQFCRYIFADDAVGSFAAWTGSKADEAMEVLIPNFKADERAVANGVLLDGDRGFVYDGSAVVLGDSGRVFRFDTPESIGIPNMQEVMEEMAALLLTR